MGEWNEDVAEVLSRLSNMGYLAVGGARISLGPRKQLCLEWLCCQRGGIEDMPLLIWLTGYSLRALGSQTDAEDCDTMMYKRCSAEPPCLGVFKFNYKWSV